MTVKITSDSQNLVSKDHSEPDDKLRIYGLVGVLYTTKCRNTAWTAVCVCPFAPSFCKYCIRSALYEHDMTYRHTEMCENTN